MSRDWISPTLTEQINNAGIILIANVKSVPQNFGGASITLNNIQYIRGCNKQEIVVDGFRGGNMCGSGIPNEGDRIIVFGCGDNSDINKNIRLHNFTSFTGFVMWSEDNENLVLENNGDAINECNGEVFSERCMKRNLDICKRIKKDIEPIMYREELVEPVLEKVDKVIPNVPVRDIVEPVQEIVDPFANFFSGFLSRRFNQAYGY